MKFITLSVIFFLFEVTLLVLYFKTFTGNFSTIGNLSTNTNDWQLFYQLANGTIMMVLTVFNIWIVYKISTSVEKNTSEREVKARLFEAQSIITQMRIRQYENIRDIVKKLQVKVLNGKVIQADVYELKKALMGIDNSFLFKNDNIKDPIFFDDLIKKICDDFDKMINQEKTYTHMSNFIIALEFYIVQQLTRDKDLKEYIQKHKGYIDSTLICMEQIEKEVLEMIEKEENDKEMKNEDER